MDEQAGQAARSAFPSEDPAERLRYYRLDRFVKELPRLPPTKGDLRFHPDDEKVRQFYVRAQVESLDDLKLWVGWPNDHIDHLRHNQHLKRVSVPFEAQTRGGDMLRAVSPQDVADAEYNVLHGYMDRVLLEQPFWSSIVRGLLERWKFIPILAIDHLDVPDGTTVTIAGTPTAYINRVTVHGSGRIRFENSGKLISDTIEHIP